MDRDIEELSEIVDVQTLLGELGTPFNALKTAEQHVQFAIDPSKGLTRRRYGWHSNNALFDSTLLSENDAEGLIDIDTTATGTDTARLRTALAGQYVSQSMAQPGAAVEIADGNVNFDSDDRVSLSHGTVAVGGGWHDGTAGGWGVGGPVQTFVGLRLDADGAECVLIANGSHLGDSPVSQAEWNINPMDGSGPNERVFHPEHGYIYNTPYTWYAYGALYVGIIDPREDQLVLFHKFDLDRSSLERPNIAPMVIVDNGGTASPISLSVGGMQYSLYGSDIGEEGGEERGTETSRRTSGTFVSDEVALTDEAINPNAQRGKPLFAIRRESGLRDLTIRMDELLPEPANDVYLFSWDEYDTDNALDGTWREPNEPIHSTETQIQVNTTCTTYTPQTAVARGWDKATTAKQNEETLSQLETDDRIPIDAGRVYTVVHDGSTTDMEIRGRVVEGY